MLLVLLVLLVLLLVILDASTRAPRVASGV